MSEHPSTQDQMALAIRAMAHHSARSAYVDRRGWTREQWIEDAESLMGDIDGSVMSLVNGHVLALLDEVRDLRKAAASEPTELCGASVRGGKCVMGAGHPGPHGQVGLR